MQVGDDVRIAIFTREHHSRISGQKLLKPEDQHRDEDKRRDDLRDAADEVREHGYALSGWQCAKGLARLW